MKFNPFKIFQIYHAVFLHYTTDYDYLKYNGKTSYKETTYEHRKDKYSFHKLSREMENLRSLDNIEYYFAWSFYNQEGWVTPRTLCENFTNFDLNWNNYSNRRVIEFPLDLGKLESLEPSHVFDKLNQGEMHYATLLLLDSVKDGFIEVMNEKLKGMFLWDSKYKKLIKFRPFYLKHEPSNIEVFKTLIPRKL